MSTSHRLPGLIALTGHAQHGKDAVTEILTIVHSFEEYAFADNLRVALTDLDPLVGQGKPLVELVEDIGWEDATRHRFYGSEVTRLLQTVELMGRRMFGDRVWIDRLAEDIATPLQQGSKVVVTDVTTDPEARLIRDLGGLVLHVVQPKAPGGSITAVSPDLIDHQVSHDSSIPDLTIRVGQLLADLATDRPMAA